MFERGKKDGPEGYSNEAAATSNPQWAGSAPKSQSSQGAAVIGRSIRIDGDLQGEEDLRIEGDVNGKIQLRNSTLTIGSEGKVRASVYAKSVAVDGYVEGDVFGAENIIVRKNAQVQGNMTAPRVSLEDGAKFKGSIEMDPDAVNAAMGGAAKTPSKPTPVEKTAASNDKVIAASEAAARKAR